MFLSNLFASLLYIGLKKYISGILPLYLCENAAAAAWILEPTTSQQMMQGALCWSGPLSDREYKKSHMIHKHGNLNKYLQKGFNFLLTTIWLTCEISSKLQQTFYSIY